jgi:hypothetical protein
MYIVTYSYELENQKDYDIEIDPPEAIASFFRDSGEHRLSPLSY